MWDEAWRKGEMGMGTGMGTAAPLLQQTGTPGQSEGGRGAGDMGHGVALWLCHLHGVPNPTRHSTPVGSTLERLASPRTHTGDTGSPASAQGQPRLGLCILGMGRMRPTARLGQCQDQQRAATACPQPGCPPALGTPPPQPSRDPPTPGAAQPRGGDTLKCTQPHRPDTP